MSAKFLNLKMCYLLDYLQPLSIPKQAWSETPWVLWKGCQVQKGFFTVLLVVDRLTKYTHFLSLKHPYITTKVASLFFIIAFKLRGMPITTV